MTAPSVIILTSGLVQTGSGQELSRLISTIRQLKKTPIVVLGPDGDELLRECSEIIDDCEIVFDPNFEGGLFSSLKAGLFALRHGGAFVLPLGAPYMNAPAWRKLEDALLTSEQEHIIRAAPQDQGGAMTFPLLVTARGMSHLRNQPAQSPWPPEREVIFRDLPPEEEAGSPASPPL